MVLFNDLAKELDSKESLGFEDSYHIMECIRETQYSMHSGITNRDNTPEEAYNLICKFMDKAEALKGPENYDKQAISSDLARACATIPVETPEMAAKLINTTSTLFEMRSDGATAKFQLETFANQGRFLGDAKVADAYLEATSKSFSKLDTPYDSGLEALKKYKGIVQQHPEMSEKILDTVNMLQNKFPDNPYYKECIDNIMHSITTNERINNDTKERAKTSINQEKQQINTHTSLQMQTSEQNLENHSQAMTSKNKRPSVKEKATDFIKNSKTYAGGKNLFSDIKNKISAFVKENPKSLTAGGAIAMFAGIGSMNPQLAAAGAIVMSTGLKAWSEKLNKMRGLNNHSETAKQPTNSIQIKAIGNHQFKNTMWSR